MGSTQKCAQSSSCFVHLLSKRPNHVRKIFSNFLCFSEVQTLSKDVLPLLYAELVLNHIFPQRNCKKYFFLNLQIGKIRNDTYRWDRWIDFNSIGTECCWNLRKYFHHSLWILEFHNCISFAIRIRGLQFHLHNFKR